ncbi:tRNA lysidine(34) synthetase TilS [Photobacterium nomapromontoriensis]|uniref:tRNA lysidine(34) synthetase TilS n=1 Tax=Photobacterium nomapromontoriensis TaxID=2910237 RepID=UPI003D0C0646
MLYAKLKASLQTSPATSNRIVLALSGGMDSRVLLHLMGRYMQLNPALSCHAVHVHHGLSPHADSWAQQCVQWAKEEGIDCSVESVDLTLGSRLSVEQQAREARYQMLAKHLQPSDILLTAQHADDQFETLLLALKRGSGPAGLSAMPKCTAFAAGWHIRPLLDVSRADIEAYATAHQLEWVEDESNRDERYDRNFLRHQITPLMTARWPGIRKAVARSATLCAEQESLLQELLADKLAAALHPDRSLCIDSLGSERQGKALIRQWLSQQGALMPSYAQMAQIWQTVVQAKPDANPKVCWSRFELRRFQQRLYLMEQWPDISDTVLDCQLGSPCLLPQKLGWLSLVPVTEGCLRMPRHDEAVSIRFEPAGLEVCPLGRAGKRKLKKLFQEYGVPSWNRRRTPLLYYGEQLAAVAGVFVVAEFAGDECGLQWLPSS